MATASRQETGDVEAFDAAWRDLDKSVQRYHFRRGRPNNQVEYAFQNHWRVFRDVMGPVAQPIAEGGRQRRALEVGCGRGSMAAFFADAGFATELLDYSAEAVRTARGNFRRDRLDGRYVAGDVRALPYATASMDVVVSIGLLEHFEDVRLPLLEQMRVLRPGGVFLGYVVPEFPESVQRLGNPVNALLRAGYRMIAGRSSQATTNKTPLYRNEFGSAAYLEVLRSAGCAEAGAFGMFPVPLVSHSPSFPFSPMSPALERVLHAVWRSIMAVRRRLYRSDPWTCDERWGLAFLVWARKPAGTSA